MCKYLLDLLTEGVPAICNPNPHRGASHPKTATSKIGLMWKYLLDLLTEGVPAICNPNPHRGASHPKTATSKIGLMCKYLLDLLTEGVPAICNPNPHRGASHPKTATSKIGLMWKYLLDLLAEGVGFEPTKGYKPLLVFKTSAFNRSATPPVAVCAFYTTLYGVPVPLSNPPEARNQDCNRSILNELSAPPQGGRVY